MQLSPLLSPYSSAITHQGHCNICFSIYNHESHKPLIICTNNHTTCKQCLMAIKTTLRCPFCRMDIRLDRIKLNQVALQQAVNNSRKGSQLGSRSSRSRNEIGVFHKNKRILIEEENDQSLKEQQSQPAYLNQSQFISHSEDLEIQEHQNQEAYDEGGCWVVLIYINIMILQVPVGLLTFYLSATLPTTHSHNSLSSNALTLRNYWRTSGYMQILMGIMLIYFMVLQHCVNLIGQDGLRAFQLLLTLLIQIKCVVSVIVYVELWQVTRRGDGEVIVDSFICSLVCNSISLLLGGYLLYKFWLYYFRY